MFDYMTVVNAWYDLMDLDQVNSVTPTAVRNDMLRDFLGATDTELTDAMIEDAFVRYLGASLADLTSSY